MINKFLSKLRLTNKSAPDYETLDFTPEEREDIKAVSPFTMTSPARMVTLSRCVEHLVRYAMEGDIVECGVWRGGSMMLVARKLLRMQAPDRNLFLFDTFDGMPKPGTIDVAWDETPAADILSRLDKYQGRNEWCYAERDEVWENLKGTAYPIEKICLVPGRVEQTLPHPQIGNIALLRLDTDWYESTRYELDCLYDKVIPGGFIIIDDYGHWKGARKAVDEFIAERGLRVFLHRIDYTGHLWIRN